MGLSRKQLVLELLDPKPGQIICDIGCGDGDLSMGLVKKVKEVHGIDISPTRVERARQRGIKAVSGDAAKTNFGSDFFDGVICSEVIEHIVDPLALMKEINRILKKGGIAVLTVPFSQEIEKTLLDVPNHDLETMDYHDIVAKYNVAGAHLNSFTEKSFIAAVKEAGLEHLDTRHTFKFDKKYKSNKLYLIVPFLKIKLRTADRLTGLENFLNRMSFKLYRKTDEKAHIIVKARK